MANVQLGGVDVTLLGESLTLGTGDGPPPAVSGWNAPRTWEGLADSRDEADRLGERDTNNRYSLNDQWRDNILETMPAKAQRAGDLFIGIGLNYIARLPKPSLPGAYALNISPLGTIRWHAYPTDPHTLTEAVGDLLQGDAQGELARLPLPATGTYILTAHGPNADLTWEVL